MKGFHITQGILDNSHDITVNLKRILEDKQLFSKYQNIYYDIIRELSYRRLNIKNLDVYSFLFNFKYALQDIIMNICTISNYVALIIFLKQSIKKINNDIKTMKCVIYLK